MGTCGLRQARVRLRVSLAVVMLLLIAIGAISVSFSGLAHGAASRRSVRTGSLKLKVRVQAAVTADLTARVAESTTPRSYSLAPETQPYLTLKQYAVESCLDFVQVYTGLLNFNIDVWYNKRAVIEGRSSASDTAAHLYIYNNSIFIDTNAIAGLKQSTFTPALFAHLKYFRVKAELPDLAFPISIRDSSGLLEKVPVTTCVAFCGRSDHQELSFPQFLEDDDAAARGTKDVPENSVGRSPISTYVQHGVQTDGHIARNRSAVWLPGDCSKLAFQLSSGAPVFKVDSHEVEWYYHLLRPFVHYIPFQLNHTHNSLGNMLHWAGQHQYAVSLITQQANDFAKVYLSQAGRECYGLQLLYRLHKLGHGNFTLPASAVDVSNCQSLHDCQQLWSL